MRPKRRQDAPAPPDAAIQEEAEQLARKAQTRLRAVVNGGDPDASRLEVVQHRDRGLAEIRELADPIDRLRAYIELAEQLAPSLPAGCAEFTLPLGAWWQSRLADLEAGRTRERARA